MCVMDAEQTNKGKLSQDIWCAGLMDISHVYSKHAKSEAACHLNLPDELTFMHSVLRGVASVILCVPVRRAESSLLLLEIRCTTR